jgi:propionate CoA-transferase
MRKNKVISADEAVGLIKDEDIVASVGFIGNGTPEELFAALEARYKTTQTPKHLTMLYASGLGDAKDKGLNRLALDGLWRRFIGGHYGLIPKIAQMALAGAFEAYNIPQGILTNLFRAVGAHRPGVLTKVGLGTYVDPRVEGGRVNAKAKEDLLEVVTLGGEEWLFMKAFPIQVALLRATTADAAGNLSFEREILTLDGLALATAVRNSGGIVIAQVERIAAQGSLNPKMVKVPGILVDYVVVARPENHMQTYGTQYNPVLSGEIRVDMQSLKSLPLDDRKVIARRAAMELEPFDVINLGIGTPEAVSNVANEEHILSYLTATVEPGVVGGMPTAGMDFGGAINAESVIDMPDQFDYYDGGGLDLTCLGMAQCDASGNVNASKFGTRLAGCGGFIDISQNTKKVVFVGTMTANGLQVAIADGKLRIEKEGKTRKFIKQVEQITFSGKTAAAGAQTILYITERAVFRLTDGQVELIEIAPGIDLERDVLAQMDFRPLMRDVRVMDARIFGVEPMGIRREFLRRAIERRTHYDPSKNLLRLDFSGLEPQTREDCEVIRDVVLAACDAAGKKVKAIVNYNAFSIPADLDDAYVEIVHPIQCHYAKVVRYANSAEVRRKLTRRFIERSIEPALYASAEEAEAALA